MIGFCQFCKTILTAEEIYFYGNRCEVCEAGWFERIEAWRKGEIDDRELDELFQAAAEVTH